MIRFDLDGTFADCEHRRKYLPNLKKIFEECVHDTPILPVIGSNSVDN
jgi:hypothetical protein